MDSTTSGSMQSSSGGGGGEEFSSHPEYISSFLTFPPPPPPPQPPNSPPFDPFSTFLSPFPPSSSPNNLTPPTCTDVADLTTDSFHPQPPQPSPPTTSLSAANTVPVQTPAPRGGSRKRSRASRKPPTTVLNTDTSNFRAMVQEFTGFPAPPFTSSSPFVRPRLGLLHPAATVTTSPPPYLLRPFPQKAQTVIDAIASITRNSNVASSSSSSEQQQQQQQQLQQQGVQQSNLLDDPIFGNLAFPSQVTSKTSSHNNMSVFFEKQQQRAPTTDVIVGDGSASWIDHDGLDQVQTQTQTQSLFGMDIGDYANSQGVDYISRLSSSTTEIGNFHATDKGMGLLSHVDVKRRR